MTGFVVLVAHNYCIKINMDFDTLGYTCLENLMKISFRTKYRDVIAFNFYVIFCSPIFLGLLVLVTIIGIKPNWQEVLRVSADRSLTFQLILFVILELFPLAMMSAILTLGLLLTSTSKKVKTVYTDRTIALGDDVRINFGDDGITSESANSHTEIQWTAVQKLVRTRSHIFLFVTQRRNLVIPKRAFDSDNAFNQFCSAFQAKVNA
jgi:hypothetical protein